ncbi:ABC transporter [Psychromonas sp. B3M02]|uniref:ABC transporter permease n=1 Tax=Psychromonas sp. B3M02 TaxID=2267226 RepID=UPI000DE878A1|nr:ABC transporter permease [Psychromonas sp. B3M02]RBW46976.1 ABC transporter [Psychromonas sp. B3M02]
MALVQKRSTLKVWGDVIFAIFLREVKSQSTDKIGLIWTVVSPLIMIAGMTAMRTLLSGGGDTHGMPTMFFMVYGMILIQFFLSVLGKTSGAVQKNKPLYAFRQVQPISSIIAIGFFELLIKIAVVFVIALICFVLQIDIVVHDAISVITNFFKVWLIGVSLGTIFGLSYCFIPELKKIQQLLTRPLFFISGIFFSLQDIPREYWHYLDWNPLLHAVELTRYAAYPSYGHEGVSYFFLDMCTLISVFFALACYHIGWKQAISR